MGKGPAAEGRFRSTVAGGADPTALKGESPAARAPSDPQGAWKDVVIFSPVNFPRRRVTKTVPTTELLSHSDFSLAHSVCEARYDMAFLIFDRTGAICQESQQRYPDLKLIQASPSVTSFISEPHTFSVEQTMSRAICAESRHDPKLFGEATSSFFEIVMRHLEIRILKRIGLRQIYFKTFAGAREAGDLITKLKLEQGSADNNFGISSAAKEAVLRWESAENGVMLHLVSIPGNAVLPVVDIRQIEKGFDDIYKSALIFDVDFYTLAPVLRSQWNAGEWIANSSHVIKKGIRSFIQKCQPAQAH